MKDTKKIHREFRIKIDIILRKLGGMNMSDTGSYFVDTNEHHPEVVPEKVEQIHLDFIKWFLQHRHELAPCPFCRGSVHIDSKHIHPESVKGSFYELYFVCSACGAKKTVLEIDIEEIFNKWNRRV